MLSLLVDRWKGKERKPLAAGAHVLPERAPYGARWPENVLTIKELQHSSVYGVAEILHQPGTVINRTG